MDLTRQSWATAGGGKHCFTLNYHLSTLNFLSTTASVWLHRLDRGHGVPCWQTWNENLAH